MSVTAPNIYANELLQTLKLYTMSDYGHPFGLKVNISPYQNTGIFYLVTL